MANKISYVGVKGIIYKEDKILITQEPLHFVGGGKWELPGGKLAVGEEKLALEEVLWREIREELGENVRVEIGELVDIIRRPWDKPGKEADMVFLATYKCKYIGGEITLSEENSSYTWVSKRELEKYDFIEGYLPILQKYFQ